MTIKEKLEAMAKTKATEDARWEAFKRGTVR